MKKIFAVSILFSLFVYAVPAGAQTTTTSVSIESLLAQIKQLQDQLAQLQVKIKEVNQERQEVVSQIINTLSVGSEGDQVAILQALLASDPEIYPEGIITGYYGGLTRQAVMRFQKKNGLFQAGVVGPLTLQKLNAELKNKPIALESSSTSTATSSAKQGRPCAIVPPGHLIAPGWLRKNNGVSPIVPVCQNVPAGILKKLATSTPTPPPPPPATSTDTTAPIVSAVLSTPSSTSALITWTTNEAATSRVFYGTSTALGMSTTLSSTLVTSHSQTISGLATSTAYFYEVQSKDAAGNVGSSTQGTFTTTP